MNARFEQRITEALNEELAYTRQRLKEEEAIAASENASARARRMACIRARYYRQELARIEGSQA